MTHRASATLSAAAARRPLESRVATRVFNTRAARLAIKFLIVVLLVRGTQLGGFSCGVNCFRVASIYIRVVSFVVRQVGGFVMRFVTGVVVAVVMQIAVHFGVFLFGLGILGVGFWICEIFAANCKRCPFVDFVLRFFVLGFHQTFGERPSLLVRQVRRRIVRKPDSRALV
jgi:hypothetical protein